MAQKSGGGNFLLWLYFLGAAVQPSPSATITDALADLPGQSSLCPGQTSLSSVSFLLTESG